MSTPDIKPRSRTVTDGLERAAARGMPAPSAWATTTGEKPQIGVARRGNEITPCNLSLDRLADAPRFASTPRAATRSSSARSRCPTASRWATSACTTRSSAATSSPTWSRRCSRPSPTAACRIAGCDKSEPGMLMAAAPDVAAVFLVYAGSILPGKGATRTSRSSTPSRRSARARGQDHPRRGDAIEAAARARRACGGMYTANTMANGRRGDGHDVAVRSRRAAEDAAPGATVAAGLARPSPCSSHLRPARSSPAVVLRTRSPCSSRWADRPTPSCTCWRSRTTVDPCRPRDRGLQPRRHARTADVRRSAATDDDVTASAGPRRDEGACWTPGCCTAVPHRHRQGRWPRTRRDRAARPDGNILRAMSNPSTGTGGPRDPASVACARGRGREERPARRATRLRGQRLRRST